MATPNLLSWQYLTLLGAGLGLVALEVLRPQAISAPVTPPPPPPPPPVTTLPETVITVPPGGAMGGFQLQPGDVVTFAINAPRAHFLGVNADNGPVNSVIASAMARRGYGIQLEPAQNTPGVFDQAHKNGTITSVNPETRLLALDVAPGITVVGARRGLTPLVPIS